MKDCFLGQLGASSGWWSFRLPLKGAQGEGGMKGSLIFTNPKKQPFAMEY